jgi:ABC-type transport system involved in multi-copper enzyme maturation permease subunit
MGILPMVWKEVYIEPGFRLNWLGKAVLALLVVVSLIPAVWIVANYAPRNWSRPPASGWYSGYTSNLFSAAYWADLGVELNPWVRIMGTAVACLMLLGVAVRASSSITGERDRGTLDALLTSPLDSHEILFAKWLGSLLSVRWAWLWLWLIWGVGLLTGAMHPIAIILCSVAWLVYASCLAGIGLSFSTTCRTSLRATLCTLCITATVGGGHWVVSLCCLPLSGLNLAKAFATLKVIGIAPSALTMFTPPGVLYWLSAANHEFGKTMEWDLQTLGVLFCLFLWALVSLFIWTATRARFRKLTARWPYRRPEFRGLPPQVSGWGRLHESDAWQDSGAAVP